MKVALISSACQHGLCGVGDYTMCLASALHACRGPRNQRPEQIVEISGMRDIPSASRAHDKKITLLSSVRCACFRTDAYISNDRYERPIYAQQHIL